ncbi:MAG: 3-deoxy-D-manno-octulosonic acid transferase [Nitrospinota bacterium]
MYFIYNLLLLLLSPALWSYYLFQKAVQGKYREGLRERLGDLRDYGLAGSGSTIWLHAVSVGEVHAAAPLVKALKGHLKGTRIVVSTVTETGRRTAEKHLKEADRLFYFPLDYPWVVRSVLDTIRPDIYLSMETELWPNLLRELGRRGVPALLVNGRISPRSFRGYLCVKPFMRGVLSKVSAFSMQSEADARRIVSLGAEPGRVKVTGNLKFDGTPALLDGERRRSLLKELGLAEGRPTILAGSTHRGEEEWVGEAFLRLREKYPSLLLILAPRRPERVPEVKSLLAARGLEVRLRTQAAPPGEHPPVLLVDTVGELPSLYSLARVAFVGGSLVAAGGQNALEPAAQRVPVIFGPHMENFSEVARLLRESGACIQLAGPEGLFAAFESLLQNPQEAAAMGERGARVVEEHRGAVEKNLKLIVGSLLALRKEPG